MLDLETINILIDENQAATLKNVVEALADVNPSLIVTPFRYGNIGDNTLVSFKVDAGHFQFVVEKLAFNGFKIVGLDQKANQIIETAKQKNKGSNSFQNISFKQSRGLKTTDEKTLEQLIADGDYTEVIKIARTITLPKEQRDMATRNIDATTQKAISNAYSEAAIKKMDIHKNLDKLIKIASDSSLKMMQKLDFIKDAGLFAIEICIHNTDYLSFLINICNNNMLHNLVNIKAAVNFYNIAVVDKDNFEEEIVMARKKLNTKWLLIAISSVENELTTGEKESFNNLINFISANRI